MAALLPRLPAEVREVVGGWVGGGGRRGSGLSMSLSGSSSEGGGGVGGWLTVRYLPFSFETRALRRLEEEEEMRIRMRV